MKQTSTIYRTEIIDGKMIITNTETGEVKKRQMASEKQINFIRKLELELDIKPKRYKDLTLWKASKVIESLIKRKNNTRENAAERVVDEFIQDNQLSWLSSERLQ